MEFFKRARPNAYDNDHSNYKHNRCPLPLMSFESPKKRGLGPFLPDSSDVTASLLITNRQKCKEAVLRSHREMKVKLLFLPLALLTPFSDDLGSFTFPPHSPPITDSKASPPPPTPLSRCLITFSYVHTIKSSWTHNKICARLCFLALMVS